MRNRIWDKVLAPCPRAMESTWHGKQWWPGDSQPGMPGIAGEFMVEVNGGTIRSGSYND